MLRQFLVDGDLDGVSARGAAGSDYSSATPSGALLKAMLIGAATPIPYGYDADGETVTLSDFYSSDAPGSDSQSTTWALGAAYGRPDYHQGFGSVILADVVPLAREHELFLFEPSVGADTTWTFEFVVDRTSAAAADFAAGSDVRVTLVWTDPPASTYCTACLVHDLDLLVSLDGVSTYPNFGAVDATNNVERVVLAGPDDGAALVVSVSAGALASADAQAFALVVTGPLTAAFASPAPTAQTTPAPSGAPAPLPTGPPSPGPTAPPTLAPSPMPTVSLFTLDASLTLTPFTCADFGATEEHALRVAVATTVENIDDNDIASNATCTEFADRRALASNVTVSATIAFTMSVPAAGSAMGSGGELAVVVGTSLEAAVASGNLTAALQSTAAALGADAALASATASGVTVTTLSPTRAPTRAPTTDQDDDSGIASLLRDYLVPIIITGCAVFFVLVAALACYLTTTAEASKMKENPLAQSTQESTDFSQPVVDNPLN